MKDLTELEVFEIVARHVNMLFEQAGDDIDAALSKLNDGADIVDLDDTALDKIGNYVNGVVMCCNIHEMFWSGISNMYPKTYKALINKVKEGSLK